MLAWQSCMYDSMAVCLHLASKCNQPFLGSATGRHLAMSHQQYHICCLLPKSVQLTRHYPVGRLLCVCVCLLLACADGEAMLSKGLLPASTAACAVVCDDTSSDDTATVRDVKPAPAVPAADNRHSVSQAGRKDPSTGTSSSNSSSSSEWSARRAAPICLVPVHGDPAAALDSTNSLCPVVAFASFAGQLGFKAIMHVAVFGGEAGLQAKARQSTQLLIGRSLESTSVANSHVVCQCMLGCSSHAGGTAR